MIRLIVYFVLIAAAATGLAWLADRPGSLTVEWLGYDVRTSVFIGAIVLIIFFAAFALAVWLGILTWTAPRRFARRLERRRNRTGQEAVRRGIFAAGAGDRAAAMKAGAIAKKNVPDEPLALLLEAQSAQLNEDSIASRQAFERMLEKPEMAELGLRGLYIEAKKAGQMDAAKQFAERALSANRALTWPSSALFEMQCRDGDWRAALRTLGIAKQNRHLGKGEADRRRALLLTQLAIELEDTQQGKALAYAQEAFDILPSLTPAAAVAGRILASQGSYGRATKLLSQAWRTAPHPEIALIFAHARTGDSPRDRLARVKTLVATGPASVEGDIAIAVSAIEAKDWAAARAALEPHLANTPPARICRLMARIEIGENRDAGRAREWLAKSARGAPDPAWVASDGAVSKEWLPMSPASGTLGNFEWKTPPVGSLDDGGDAFDEMSSLVDAAVTDAEDPPGATVSAAAGFKPSEVFLLPKGDSATSEDGAGALAPDDEGFGRGRSAKFTGDDASERPNEAILMEKDVSTSAEQSTKLNQNEHKNEASQPNIFVPRPAPDDPGERPDETEEESTSLAPYRRSL